MSIPASNAGGSGSENKIARLNSSGKLAATMGGGASQVAILDSGALVPATNAPAKAVYSTGGAQALVPSDIGAASSADLTAAINGLDLKASVKVATTGNITLSGNQTIDGVSVTAGMRVLVADQTDATTRGIYVSSAGAWSRSTDCDVDAEVTTGLATFIEEGTTHGGKMAYLTTTGTIVVGTTELSFARVAAFQLYSSTPAAISGSGSAGSSAQAAKGDHVHPSTGIVMTDGSNAMAANLPMGGFEVTGAAAATASNSLATLAQVTAGTTLWHSSTLSSNTALSDSGLGWGKWYKVSGTVTITLPDAALASNIGEKIKIVNVGTGTVTVAAFSGNSLNGTVDGTVSLTVQYESLDVIEDGTDSVFAE